MVLASKSRNGSFRPLWEYLPQVQQGSILITTRSKSVALKFVEERNVIAVEPMDETQAVELFEKKQLTQSNQKDTLQLVAALEFMPLAIVQAAAYISQRAPRCSVQEYVEKFQRTDRSKTSLLAHEAGHLRRDRDAKNSIIITWQISFDHISKERQSAADLLSLMSFFDRQEIPEYLLRNGHEIGSRFRDLETPDSSDEERDSEESKSEISTTDNFEEDILILRNYSFIFANINKTTFTMHRLVQLAMQEWLKIHSLLEKWKSQHIKSLCREFPPGNYENWGRCGMLFPHTKLALVQKPEGDDVLEEWALLLYNAAWYAQLRGYTSDAEKMAAKSLKVRKKQHGLNDSKTLSSKAMVASIFGNQGRWTEAEELEVQVMETRKRVLGQEHPDTLTSMANLASTFGNQGRWTEAEELDVQVMERSLRVLGQEHPDTLNSMNNLACTWKGQNRDQEAIDLISSCVQIMTRKLGANHPHTLTCTQTYKTWKMEQ